MMPGKLNFLDELMERSRLKQHLEFFGRYYIELTLFDKTRLKRVRSPGWVSWYVYGDKTWRDPHPGGIPKWVLIDTLHVKK